MVFRIKKNSVLPGRIVPLKGHPKEGFLVVTEEGYRIYEGICPHLLGPLIKGEIQKGEIICPWHGYRFDLKSGACTTPPGFCFPLQKSSESSPAPLSLRPIPFTTLEEGDEIVVETKE